MRVTQTNEDYMTSKSQRRPIDTGFWLCYSPFVVAYLKDNGERESK